jgi:hypothetical protein
MRVTSMVLVVSLLSATAYGQSTETDKSTGADGDQVAVRIGGYIRARHGTIFEGEGGPDFVGLNDGFTLENARLVVDLEKADLTGRISIDGAVDRRAASNTSVGRVDVGLKDAWIGYSVCRHFDLQVGQFKPPFDAEELQSTAKMLFIDRAVESRGIRGTEGYNVEGLSLDRQAGITANGRFDLGQTWAMSYGVSVTNGSGANYPQNDNDQLAYTGRITVEQGKHLVLGGGFHMNQTTDGIPPDLLVDDRMAWVVDLTYQRQVGPIGVHLAGQYMESATQSVDVSTEPEIVARGYHGAVGLELPRGYIVAYRYAVLDPTADFEAEDPVAKTVLDIDSVTLHTAAVGYQVQGAPLKVQLNYTLAMEQEGRAIDNDRLDLLFQAVF